MGVSTNGRGGQFAGTAAQVQLVPSTSADHPISGEAGDLFLDATGRLWLCKTTSTDAAIWALILTQ